jgi:putative DNA primase/helicase
MPVKDETEFVDLEPDEETGKRETGKPTKPDFSDESKISNPLLRKLYRSMEKVDLVQTLIEKAGDPLSKYQNSDGEVNRDKVPVNLYIVAVVLEIIDTAKRNDLALCVKHGGIYAYNGKYWEELPEDSVKQALSLMAIRLGYPSPAAARVSDFRDKLYKQFIADGIEEAPEEKEGGPTLINLSNCTLEVTAQGVKPRKHSREDFLTYCLEYEYDETRKAPIFSKYLERVLPEAESRQVLQEFMGYSFTRGLKLEKALVLYGDGHNGKSVLFEVVTAIFGKKNIAHKGLGELCSKDGYGHRAEIENKLLNYASEINPRGADIELFKAIVSQEPVTARRLYKDSFEFRPTVKLIFNANKLPAETERTEAYFRRFLILPFEVRITEEEKDPRLHEKIISQELPGVLNWIIEGLRRVVKNEKFTDSPKAGEAMETYRRESNSVAQFVEEYGLEKSNETITENKELYKAYTQFCSESGHRPMNQINFSKELKALEFKPHRTKKFRGFFASFGE